MKKLICLALLLNACSESNEKIEGKPPTPTAPTVVVEAPVTPPTGSVDFDPKTGFIVPPKRNFLYECNRQSKASESGPDYRAFIEIMSDGSRAYHVNVIHQGYPEDFTAIETRNAALNFTPFNDEPSAYQGSDVIHSMLEITQIRYNLSNQARFQLNLKNDAEGQLVLTLSAIDQGKVKDIGGGVSYCEVKEY